MSLKEIYCQDKAIGILQKAYGAGRVPHAYIFAGPDGVGKFTSAKQWAKLLLCAEPVIDEGFADSCGQCESCGLLEADSHPDFEHVYKELKEFTKKGKGKPPPIDFPIDVVREFVIDKVSNRPALSQRRIFILSETEKLNNSSQNALLKVLEEPPDYCSIIMICTRLDELLATTKSRAHTIRFGPIEEDRIVEYLQTTDIAEQSARYFARLSQGSIGLASEWAKLELEGAELCGIAEEVVGSLANADYADSLELAGKFLKHAKSIGGIWAKLDSATSKSDLNRRAIKTVLHMIISALQDTITTNISPGKALTNFQLEKHIQRLSQRFDADKAAEHIAECYKSIHWVESSVNETLIFEQLLLNLLDSAKMRV